MLDAAPTPSDTINARIATQVRALRAARGMSLDALAARCGVSRSMISLVERGESSPTAVVLERLATGLGVTLASLFDDLGDGGVRHDEPVARRRDQVEWKDPVSGYVRRNVSPPHVPQPMRIADIRFPAGARVAFDTAEREPVVHQQIWLLEGTMEIALGRERHRLREGDCLAMRLDRPVVFHNPTRKAARYAVVITSGTTQRR